MAKGNEAKQNVLNVIAEAFGSSFVGVVDKKIYVEAEEDGKMIQVCISLTCPKTPIERRESAGPIGEPGSPQTSAVPTPTELSPADKAKVQELMKRLNVPIKS